MIRYEISGIDYNEDFTIEGHTNRRFRFTRDRGIIDVSNKPIEAPDILQKIIFKRLRPISNLWYAQCRFRWWQMWSV